MYIAVLKSVHFPYRFTRLYKFSEKTYKRIFFAEKNYRRINYRDELITSCHYTERDVVI